LPTLHASSPHGEQSPSIRIELKQILAGGVENTVATSQGGGLSYTTSQAGAYRADLFIRPHHLREQLTVFEDIANDEYRWAISNHLYLQ
jgi:hypothetical protein